VTDITALIMAHFGAKDRGVLELFVEEDLLGLFIRLVGHPTKHGLPVKEKAAELRVG
jgi:hypothetical protein